MSDIEAEELASLCLERLQVEGEQAIEQICREHPEQAVRIRGMVRQLQKLGLVDEPQPEMPETFGDFRLLERIGGGGMGVVFLAEQKSLGRTIAVPIDSSPSTTQEKNCASEAKIRWLPGLPATSHGSPS